MKGKQIPKALPAGEMGHELATLHPMLAQAGLAEQTSWRPRFDGLIPPKEIDSDIRNIGFLKNYLPAKSLPDGHILF